MKKPLLVTAIILAAPMIHAAFLGDTSAPAALSINSISLPQATALQTYRAPALSASGGAPPYSWSLTAAGAKLPEGMTIDPSTGVISSPSVGGQGRYQFQVQVKDSAGTISTAYETINIAANSAHNVCTPLPAHNIFHQRADSLPMDSSPAPPTIVAASGKQ